MYELTGIPTEADNINQNDTAFNLLITSLEVNLYNERQGFLVKSLRDKYRGILRELGVKTADTYRPITLKWKLIRHFGWRVSILDQSIGSGFICASDIPLGDALDKLRRLENEYNVGQHQTALYRAARILREDAKACKKKSCNYVITEVSLDSASNMVPDYFFIFAALCQTKSRVTQWMEHPELW